MASKRRSKDTEGAQYLLGERQWTCIHGILMMDECGDCAAATFHDAETRALEVSEQQEEMNNGD